jgi:hypothetical protein
MVRMTMTEYININDSYSTFTDSALTERIKKELASIKIDTEKYKQEIEKHRITEGKNYYDYDLDLDFSRDPKIIDDRKYYNRAFHYQKIGLFPQENIPWLKISLQDLSLESVKALSQLEPKEREYIAKQAYGRIFEDINSDIYHNSISSILKVKFIDGSEYDYNYTVSCNNVDSKEEYLEEKRKLINQILLEQKTEDSKEKRLRLLENDEIDDNNNYIEIQNEENSNNNNNSNEKIDLLELIKSCCVELFVDQYNNPYVALKINDHVEIWSLNSNKVKYIFFRICYEKTK